MSRSAVLISGASFAGLATAWWMTRLGYQVTLIEVAKDLRKGGTPVDIAGETIDVLERMGLLNAVLAKALPARRFEFKDAQDTTLGTFGGERDVDDAHSGRYEIHRDDLLDILNASISGSVEMVFSQSIKELAQTADSATVTFSDDTRRDYTLVIGCDGNRSNTRRLLFPNSETSSYFMGGYFFIKVVPVTGLLPADVSQVFSVAGRTAMLNGYDNQTDIVLAFRVAREFDYDYRDRALQRRLIHEHFDGLGWKVPAMLEHLDADDDFYFDSINQIRMPTWTRGRVALVGDAGYCVSPVAGFGGSMALIGAARLADALGRHGDDHTAAFAEYHEKLAPFVTEVQERAVAEGMAMMFPSDEAELAERDRRLNEGGIEL